MKKHQPTSAEIMGLTDSHLVAIDDNHKLRPEVVSQFIKMQQAAAEDGVDLQICSSFRDFSKQLSIWNRKWRGELPLYTLHNTKLDSASLSNIEKIHAIMLWSALPGASRHHWGTDFDVYDKQQVIAHQHDFELVPSEYEKHGPCAALSKWVLQHAQEYGFYLPYATYVGGVAKEPWHLSYQPTATGIQRSFKLNDLYAQLKRADIMGKETILEHLPLLVNQYTYNRGPNSGV